MAPVDGIEYAMPISLVEILFLIFLNWVIERYFSGFLYIFVLLCFAFVSYLWKSRSAYRKITDLEAATCRPSIREVDYEVPSKENVEMLVKETRGVPAACTRGPGRLSIGEVRTMIDQVFDELEHNDTESYLGLNMEVEEIFEEEPSLGEVKEAFDLFDENGDGFIDADDLKIVLSAMGFTPTSEVDECRKMISAFDNNGDGRIDFGEFAKLIELSFC